MMTVRKILHWFFSFPQALASDVDRAERGLIGANPTGFCTGGLGGNLPQQGKRVTAQSKCNFDCVRTLALPCRISFHVKCKIAIHIKTPQPLQVTAFLLT